MERICGGCVFEVSSFGLMAMFCAYAEEMN
jgi:hypothetical protein